MYTTEVIGEREQSIVVRFLNLKNILGTVAVILLSLQALIGLWGRSYMAKLAKVMVQENNLENFW